jgi:hypothetical protein
MGFKVDNDAVWQQCKEGNRCWFIESLKEVNNNINIQMNKPKKKTLKASFIPLR